MQLTNLFDENDGSRAVSPVIGVILMVAITVILAAVIGTFVLGLGDQIDSTPQASFDFDLDESNNKLTITHSGGDSFNGNDISIQIDGEAVATSSVTNSFSSDIQAGSTATIDNSGKLDSGVTVNIVYTSEGQGSIIASYDVPKDASL